MYTVTVCTSRYVGIAIGKGAAVDAVLIDIKGLGMALGAGSGDFLAGGDG